MITLNLISNRKKEELKIQKISLIAKNIVYILSIFVITITAFSYFFERILQSNLNIIKTSNSMGSENQKLNQEIEDLNTEFSFIKQINDEKIYWSSIIYEITKIMPKNTKLFNLNIKKNEGEKNFTLSMDGIAKTRDSVVIIRENLKKIDFITNIDFPISNLLSKEYVNFQIFAVIEIK